MRTIEFSVEEGDFTTYTGDLPVDVVALKYALGAHGAGYQVANQLIKGGALRKARQPAVGQYAFVGAGAAQGLRTTLFVGVHPLAQFDYPDIRQFMQVTLAALHS